MEDPIRVNIANVAVEKDMYTFIGPDKRPTLEVEHVLANVESAVTPTLKRINQSISNTWITAQEKNDLAWFTAYQVARTPAMRRTVREIKLAIAKDIAAALGKTFTPPADNNDKLEKIFMLAALDDAPRIKSLLMTRQLVVFRVNDPPFITCDYPATQVQPPKQWEREFFEVFMPIGSKAAILWKQTADPVMLELKMNVPSHTYNLANVLAINKTSITSAERYLFASFNSGEIKKLFDRTQMPTRMIVEEF